MISQKPDATMDPADEVMTAPVAAALKGVHRNSVHNAIKDGRLKATRSGKTWLIRRRDLDAWQVIGHRPKAKPNDRAPVEAPLSARERAEKVIQLLDEWMADESGHDEEMWPKLKAVLEEDRLSSRPLFVNLRREADHHAGYRPPGADCEPEEVPGNQALAPTVAACGRGHKDPRDCRL